MMPVYNLGGGKVFTSYSRHAPDYDLGLSDVELRALVMDKWAEAYDAKRAETERLKRCELYWAGFHFENPIDNRNNPITNFCFSHVETLHPILTESRPRPEIAARNSMTMDRATRLQSYAQWLMDTSSYDSAVRLGTRDKLKFGWQPYLLNFDRTTGLLIPQSLSVFKYYPDPTATNESELEYFIIAGPVGTARCRALFPNALGDIVCDNIADPGYEVYERPYRLNEAGWSAGGPTIIGPSIGTETSPGIGTSAYGLTSGGDQREYGRSTFVVQLFIRDHGKNPVCYLGDCWQPGADGNPMKTPHFLTRDEPRSDSGWCVISMAANGTLLEKPGQLDPAYGGMPIVVGRDYQQTGRYYSKGELDDLIPVQRDINRRDFLLIHALELAARPPVLADTNAGLNVNQSEIEGGEILKKKPGSQVGYLEYRGPAEWQFALRHERQRDFDTVGGAHDVTQGARPAGIEAAAAIEKLQQAAMIRIRGKQPAMFEEQASMLKKMMIGAGKKLGIEISFYAQNGMPFSINPADLLAEYDIRFAEGTGTVAAQEQLRNEATSLYQLGLVDEQYVWDTLDLKGREAMAVRMQQRMEAQLKAQAAAAAQTAGNKKGAAVGGRG